MRIILATLLSLFLSVQILSAEPLFKTYKTTILQTNGATATIADSADIVLGSSGIVTHKISDDLSSILARVDVIEKNGKTATLRFDVYKLSTQSAFPKPGLLPAVGDKVVLNYLYDRALIVAPNYDVFKEITEHFADIEWVHPDIAAAYLAKEFRPNPDREIFQSICAQNAVALIFFALNDQGVFVDCNNFQIVKSFKSGRIKEALVPFYTRVRGIETSFIKWDSKNISDYDAYYRNIIGQ